MCPGAQRERDVVDEVAVRSGVVEVDERRDLGVDDEVVGLGVAVRPAGPVEPRQRPAPELGELGGELVVVVRRARHSGQGGDDHAVDLLDEAPGRGRDRGGSGCAEVVQRPRAGRRPSDVGGLGCADRRHPQHQVTGKEHVRRTGPHEHGTVATPSGRGLVGEGAAVLVVEQARDADQLGDGQQGG